MTNSSSDNLPIADTPTRDVSSVEGEHDFTLGAAPSGLTIEVPRRIGDYEIRRLLGTGGMGQVFLAEHTRMQRAVAIKILPMERMGDARSVERFYDEVRAASRLMHPNIVTAFDAGEANGVHYMAMEYVDGLTLTRLVASHGPLSVGEASAVIRQAALGLLHAHRAGIVHRDVKPGNLMRAADGTVKVLDLGLATLGTAAWITAEGEATGVSVAKRSKGRLIGTLPFMAPEQLEDPDSVDPRSDIYSLGATFYFLLTARPPFSGEYLEQVYGHRHGEIPDLMQARDDVDIKLAHIFTRMMAKSPDERYASLDEVIDDLSDYADVTDTPQWLAEFSQRQLRPDQSTIASDSTAVSDARVLAIDFGMFYSATADATPEGNVRVLAAGGKGQSLFRMAVASDGNELLFGNEALDHRFRLQDNLAHSLPIYIGKRFFERKIAGKQCPPEVLLAMLFRRIQQNVWKAKSPPRALAITIPASYDQYRRQSILHATRIAGFTNVRLVDRSMAAVQSLLATELTETIDPQVTEVQSARDAMVLFVGVTGQATEVSIIRRETLRLHQLATAGHWHSGTPAWQHRLIDLAAEAFVSEHRFDPRDFGPTASRLQAACERAMNSMLLMKTTRLCVERNGKEFAVHLQRDDWLKRCDDLVAGVRDMIHQASEEARVPLSSIATCVTQGALLRMPQIRDAILDGLPEGTSFRPLDRSDVAMGAAAALAAELPGRGDIPMPPRTVSSQTIGIVVEDAKGRRRILPIIPKGTSLPARTNRRLTVGEQRESMTLSLVETSGTKSGEWHSLGRYEIHIDDNHSRARMIGFEVDINGLLKVRAQAPGTPGSTRLPPLPTPNLTEEEVAEWKRWLDRYF